MTRQAHRRDRLRAEAAGRWFDAVLVTSLVNVRYLTGFTGSNGAVLVGATAAGDAVATDSRYRIQVGVRAPDLPAVIERAAAVAMLKRASGQGMRRVGYESHDVTVDGLRDLAAAAPDVELVSAERAVEGLRAVKDEAEIATLGKACAIADRALAGLLADGGLRAGRSERAVALDLDRRMLELGAAAVSFETIVAAGPAGASPHHRPDDRPLADGDLVVIDFGAEHGGYHSDMTRTVGVGTLDGWQRDLYDVVARAHRAGCAAVIPGASTRAVDAAARSVIDQAGHGAEFGHGLGHGVGLEIHEAPALGPSSAGTLGALMTVTVEPGVYVEGRGGVRIEDTLVVRDGEPELLTTTGRDLITV